MNESLFSHTTQRKRLTAMGDALAGLELLLNAPDKEVRNHAAASVWQHAQNDF